MYRQEYIPPIQPRSRSWRQGEVREVNPLEKAPSVVIKVEYDKKNPNSQKIVPTRESIKALAEWYKKNGMKPDARVSVTGTEIGTKELSPLFSQEQNFDEGDFQQWASGVMGAGVISEMPEPELPILRKIYGNLGVIETMRQEKRKNDIKKWTISSLTRMELDNKMNEILDDRFWKPLEFKEDIDMLNARIRDDKEYWPLGEEAIDYMFGCIIKAHILWPGKKLTIKDNQPIVETGNAVEDAQWKWVFETVKFFEKDGQSKIADYVAAHSYHHVNKDLVWYYGDLSQKIVGTSPDINITAERIESSSLSPSEKSFMSLWLNKDVRLGDIQARQQKYVEQATENAKGKSSETLKRDFSRDAIWTLAKMNPLLGAGLFVGIFWGILAMIWSKDSKLAKFFLTLAAGLWLAGVAVAAPWAMRSLQKWWLDNGNAVTQAPRRTVNTGDWLTDAWRDIEGWFAKNFDRFAASFSTANDWRKLVLDERVGPKLVNKYPTGAILSVLNPDPDSKYNEDGKWKWTTTQEKEIKKILEKLEPEEQNQLNTMLQETWNRYKEAQGTSLTHEQLQNGTMKNMIDAIDVQFGWFSKLWRPAYWSGEEEKLKALSEFTKRPKKWEKTKMGDLMVEWFTWSRTDLPTGWTVDRKTINLVWTVPANKLDAMKSVITKIWEENKPCDPTKTLGELLTKE